MARRSIGEVRDDDARAATRRDRSGRAAAQYVVVWMRGDDEQRFGSRENYRRARHYIPLKRRHSLMNESVGMNAA